MTLDDLRASLQSTTLPLAARAAQWLPLEELDPAVFERLVAEIVQVFGSPTVHFYGRGGQRQYGLDIFEERTDKTRVVYQVKRFQEIGPKDLAPIVDAYIDAVDDAQPVPTLKSRTEADANGTPRFEAHEFVIVTSALVDDDTARTDALRELQKLYGHRITIALWGKERLSRQLRGMPNLVMVVFGEAWAREWCGADAVRNVSAGTEREERVNRALTGAMRVQFDKDNRLRFRQIEMSSVTVDSLFVDVPVTAIQASDAEQLLSEINPQSVNTTPRPVAGAAQVLLHPRWHKSAVVLGGPGQGKTTLLQYLCQFHRARSLDIDQYSPIAAGLDPVSPVKRVAVKVDLTEYAEWRRSILSVQATAGPAIAVEPGRVPGLLQHVAGLISTLSAVKMTVEDFAYAASSRPMFIALDSLDEVADPGERDQVTDQIRLFESQLRSSAVDVLLVVATRPGNVGRPIWRDPQFAALSLERLTAPLRLAYLDRWCAQSKLTEREVADLRAAFVKNIASPHVEDLAGNPMQLAILLHLMQRRTVLPEKRTDLYEKYIDVFMDRESKSQLVADNKDMILRFHKLLAWHIQCQVEQGKSKGTITLASLRELLTTYLTPRGKDASFIEELFGSVTTRVLCLVPKDLNAQEFQFEVQPLREYFAAAYVYDMLPSRDNYTTPAGVLQVFARRPYWLNVLRFFAGQMKSSEVTSIFYALDELKQDASVNGLPIARSIAKLLLDDQVFSGQYAKVFEDIVRLILDGPGATLASLGMIEQASGSAFTFNDETGAKAAADFLLDLLEIDGSDYISICNLLNGIAPQKSHAEWILRAGSVDPVRWLSVLCRLGAASRRGGFTIDDLRPALHAFDGQPRNPLLPLLMSIQISDPTDELLSRCVEELALGWVPAVRYRAGANPYTELAYLASPDRMYDALDRHQISPRGTGDNGMPRPGSRPSRKSRQRSGAKTDGALGGTIEKLEAIYSPDNSWNTDLTWYDTLDRLATIWGESTVLMRQLVATLPHEYCLRYSSEPSFRASTSWRSLAGWRWVAQQNAEAIDWWRDQAATATKPSEVLSFAMGIFRDARAVPAFALVPDLNEKVDSLSTAAWTSLVAALHRDLRRNRGALNATDLSEAVRLHKVEPNSRCALTIWPFVAENARQWLSDLILKDVGACWSDDPAVVAVLVMALDAQPRKVAPEIFRGAGRSLDGSFPHPSKIGPLTFSAAQGILDDPQIWPQEMVALAIDRLSQRLARQQAVAVVASERGWGTELS